MTLHQTPSNGDDDIVIVSAVRTPLTRARKGGLAQVPPAMLLSTVLKGVVQRCSNSNIPIQVDDVCVGNVLLPPAGFAALRMAQLTSVNQHDQDTNNGCSFQTVNRQCASGLQAVAHIANAIQAGEIQVGIGAGVESMSLTQMNKMALPKGVIDLEAAAYRDPVRQTNDAMDCLLPMGLTSETVARKYGLERHVMDQFAVESHVKAAKAQAAGKFDSEIVSVGSIIKDDGIRADSNLASLSKLKPAFLPTGSTTAGNSSQTTDGAGAVLLMTRKKACELNLPVLGVWRGYATASVPPSIMGIGPAIAIPKLLQQTGIDMSQIDIFEINEAFASQALYCIHELGLDMNKVNPNGGAIALGHPLGATGARMIATLLPEMHRQHAKYGVVSMCIGTGMGAAALIEVESYARL